MNRRCVLGVLIAGTLAWQPAAASSGSSTSARPHVVVRSYHGALVDGTDWQGALAAAGELLAGADVDIEWLSCDAREAAAAACERPLATGELALRVVDLGTPPRYLGRLPLGYSLVDARRHVGTLATIYLDRVRWLAWAAGTDVLVLTARAIAHEIGHLLLGENDHSASGLMRAVWDRDELRRGRIPDWSFTRGDAAAMRDALSVRARRLAAEESSTWAAKWP